MEFIICIAKDVAMLIIVVIKPALKDWGFFYIYFWSSYNPIIMVKDTKITRKVMPIMANLRIIDSDF
jgi:hypothetical protein